MYATFVFIYRRESCVLKIIYWMLGLLGIFVFFNSATRIIWIIRTITVNRTVFFAQMSVSHIFL